MKKPCDDCQNSILQAIYDGEITCFQKCERLKRWLALKDEKDL